MFITSHRQHPGRSDFHKLHSYSFRVYTTFTSKKTRTYPANGTHLRRETNPPPGRQTHHTAGTWTQPVETLQTWPPHDHASGTVCIKCQKPEEKSHCTACQAAEWRASQTRCIGRWQSCLWTPAGRRQRTGCRRSLVSLVRWGLLCVLEEICWINMWKFGKASRQTKQTTR